MYIDGQWIDISYVAVVCEILRKEETLKLLDLCSFLFKKTID